MFTLSFWKATAERTIRTAAGSLASFVVAESVTDVDWGFAFGITGGAALATVLLALAGGMAPGDGPGLTEHVKGGTRE